MKIEVLRLSTSNAVYLYDDHFTLLINASKKPISVEDIPLDDIEAAFKGEDNQTDGGSRIANTVPPTKKGLTFWLVLFYILYITKMSV